MRAVQGRFTSIPSIVRKGSGEGARTVDRMRSVLDGTFHAIATILHRVPRELGEVRGKRKAGTPRHGDRDPMLGDIAEGWIRVAL